MEDLLNEEAGRDREGGRYGASLGGALCYINNPTLFSHTCLHMTRDEDQTRRHKKHKQRHKKHKQHDKQHHHSGVI
jgi:hypothetical protein